MQEDVFDWSKPFEVTTPAQADWCVRKIAQIDADLKRWTKFYDDCIAKEVERHQRSIDFYRGHLQAFFDSYEHKHVNRSHTVWTLPLPSGQLTLKVRDPEYQRDNAALVEWLKAADRTDLIKEEIKQTANWAALKKECGVLEDGILVLKSTGEVVEGVRIVPRGPEFIVTHGEDEQDAD